LTLRRKSQLVVGITFLALVAMLIAIDQIVISRAYEDLEHREVREETQRAANAVATELRDLSRFLNDWSSWDDTYAFVAEPSPAFLESNLLDETFEVSNLNVIVIAGLDGRLRYARAIDLESGSDLDLPSLTEGPLAGRLLLPAGATEAVVGLYRSGDHMLLLAARPILTSMNSGPSRGTIIMGRFLSPALVATFAQDLQLSIEMTAVDAETPRTGPPTGPPAGDVLVTPIDGAEITGATALLDIEGNPAVTATVTMPRDIYREGVATFRELAVVLSGGTLILMLVMTVVLERAVLGPVRRLGGEVASIGERRDASARLLTGGRDEVGRLATEVNEMLASLQEAAEERVGLQARATESQRLAESVLAEMAEGVVVLDARGICRMCNRAAARLLWVEQSAIVGQPLELIRAVPPAVRQVVARVVAGTNDIEPTYTEVRERLLVLQASSYGDREGAPAGWIVVLRDVTEATREAQRRRDFLAIIGHELRTPATVIRTSIDLLGEQAPGSLSPMQQRIVDVLGANTQRLLAVLEDLMDLSAIEAGQLQVIPDTEDIGNLVAAAVEAQRPQADAAGISITYRPANAPVQARADRQRVRQVLANLLSNAIKYTPTGGAVTVEVARDPKRARVSVRDTGIGVTSEEQARLFQPYYRSPRARQFGTGTGLGLSIARALAELHGGMLWCESDGEHGSTFHFTLPLIERSTPVVS